MERKGDYGFRWQADDVKCRQMVEPPPLRVTARLDTPQMVGVLPEGGTDPAIRTRKGLLRPTPPGSEPRKPATTRSWPG